MSTTISEPIHIGMGISTITPPLGVELAGYGYYLQRKCTGVHDNVYSRVLVIEGEDKTKIAVVSNDLSSLSWELVEKIKSVVSSKAGIDEDNILITCTHTHSGPAAAYARGVGEVDPRYAGELPSMVAQAATEACKNLKSARLGLGKGEVNIVSRNRCEENGPIDPSVGVMKINDLSEAPLALLFNFACHPTTIDRRTPAGTLVSRDWPGYAVDVIKSELSTNSMFLQGACGDIGPVVGWHNFQFEGASLTGYIVGSKVIEIVPKINTSNIKRISLKKKIVHLPLRILSEEEIDKTIAEKKQKDNWNKGNLSYFYKNWEKSMKEKLRKKSYLSTLPAEVALLTIETDEDRGALVFLPGEIFVRLGLEIKRKSPFNNVFIIEHYGNRAGYIPDEFDFKRGGYAATEVPRINGIFPYKQEVGEVLVNQTLKLF